MDSWVWVLRTPNAGQNMLFSHFLHENVKKGQKEGKQDKIRQKTCVGFASKVNE